MSSFTILALLPSCTLSKSSLPLLIPSEIQISTIEQTELRLYSHPSALESSTSKAPKLTELGQRSSPDLTLTLTTHRLIFATKNGECCVYFPLSSINLKSTKSHSSALASAANATTCITTNITITPSLTIHKRNAHFGRSPKIHFETKSNYLAAEVVVKFDSTRGNVERDDLYDDVVRAVGRKGWEKDEGAIGEGVDSFENIFIHLVRGRARRRIEQQSTPQHTSLQLTQIIFVLFPIVSFCFARRRIKINRRAKLLHPLDMHIPRPITIRRTFQRALELRE